MGCCSSTGSLPLTPEELKQIADEAKGTYDKANGVPALVRFLVKIHNKNGIALDKLQAAVREDKFLPNHYAAQGVAIPADLPQRGLKSALEELTQQVATIFKKALGPKLKMQLPSHIPDSMKDTVVDKGVEAASGLAVDKVVDIAIEDEVKGKPGLAQTAAPQANNNANTGARAGGAVAPQPAVVVIVEQQAAAQPAAAARLPVPEGDWVYQAEHDMYWSAEKKWWFNDKTGDFHDTTSNQRFDNATQAWVQE